MRSTSTRTVILVLLTAGSWLSSVPASAQGEPGEPPAESQPETVSDDNTSEQPGDSSAGQTPQQPTSVVDFGDEEGFGIGEVMTTQDPTPLKHKSLIRKKFRGPKPGGVAAEQLVEVPSRWSTGVHVGGSWVTFAGPEMAGESPVGLAVGVFAEFRATRFVAIQPEARLVMRGALGDESGQSVRLAYLEFPVLARLSRPAGPVTLGAGIGPTLGVSLRSAVGASELARFVLGGLVDLSARTRGGDWLFALRYEHGLSALGASGLGALGDIRPRTVSLGVGLVF